MLTGNRDLMVGKIKHSLFITREMTTMETLSGPHLREPIQILVRICIPQLKYSHQRQEHALFFRSTQQVPSITLCLSCPIVIQLKQVCIHPPQTAFNCMIYKQQHLPVYMFQLFAVLVLVVYKPHIFYLQTIFRMLTVEDIQ